MKHWFRRGIIFTGILLGATVAGLYGRGSLAQPSLQEGDLIPQPSKWVPFSADVGRVKHDGVTTVGRFYRSSDGSTRTELGPSPGKVDSVSIKNIATSTLYRGFPNGTWTAQPMKLPPWGWRPVPTRFASSMTQVDDTVDGLSLVRLDTGREVMFEAPELNLFPVTMLQSCDAETSTECGIWHFNIAISEQPNEYFQAPKDVEITRVDTPGGIVWHAGPQGEHR